MTHVPLDELLREQDFPGNTQAFKELSSFVRDGAIVGFTGAGVSVPQFPTWLALLSALVDDAVKQGLLTEPRAIEDYKKQIGLDPLELANSVEELFGRKVFRAKFGNIFANPSGTCTPCHIKISDLNLHGIVTLNYDDGHEVAYAKRGRRPNVGRSQDASTLTRWLQADVFKSLDPPILHLHGDVSDPERMILTADDYDTFYSSSLPETLIKQLWQSHRLLVLGFGFSDPFLTRAAEASLRSLPSDIRHFALVGRSDPVSPYERRAFSRKYRLNPIFYRIRSAPIANDHSDLLRLLDSLPPMEVDKPDERTAPKQLSTGYFQFTGTSPTFTAPPAQSAKLEQDLFVAPNGTPLYVEPKLSRHVDQAVISAMSDEQISVRDLIESEESYVITARQEYGATTLAKRLIKEFSHLGRKAYMRDASLLPNYKKKLIEQFSAAAISADDHPVLIIDGFDFAQHERLLKEVIGTGIFYRLIILASVNFFGSQKTIPIDQFKVPFTLLSLSHLTPPDIRTLTTQFFETSDQDIISLTVHKIYSDLISLCIPITPANVIMYLTILYREGDFAPINRVQIVGRYISECLRRPSDVFTESFTSKNKMDVLSEFVFRLSQKGRVEWNETDWFVFCREQMESKLTQFDDRGLLNELLATRILVRAGRSIAFKYRFFHVYFLGRYVASHSGALEKFIEDDSYLKHEGLVEVISEITADNERLVSRIIAKLSEALDEFGNRYIPEDFDPFSSLTWPLDPKEGDNLWKPLFDLVGRGPRNPSEIDQIKRSLIGERRTADQTLVVRQFDQVEQRLIHLHLALVEAIRNPDNLTGETKKAAVICALKGFMIIYQIGTVFSSEIIKSRFFQWHGILFINDMDYKSEDDERRRMFITAAQIHFAVLKKLTDTVGSRKLGEVFKNLSREGKLDGFLNLAMFSCLIRAKPKGWDLTTASVVADVERKSFDLKAMLRLTFTQFYDEVNTGGEREELKRLIATIRIKRDLKKDHPGTRELTRVITRLEEQEYFEQKGNRNSESGDSVGEGE